MRRHRLVILLGFCAILLPATAWGQSERLHERPAVRDAQPDDTIERFELAFGAMYDQGKFGTPVTTRTLSFPATVTYVGDRFDAYLSTSLDHVESSGPGIVLFAGTPTATGDVRRRTEAETGSGDTRLKGRYFLLEDPGPSSAIPGVSPYATLKLPTGSRRKGLGTGEVDYGVGVDLDKNVGPVFLFADVSYNVIGDPPGQTLRDRPEAGVGLGRDLFTMLTATVEVDWRRALVPGDRDELELVGRLEYRITRGWRLRPEVSVGLMSGSSDFGVGIEIAYRFGRY
jgi:hypothetical protein